ncbi:MAG: hypothetical protein V7709_18380 [Halioglobus sp.]
MATSRANARYRRSLILGVLALASLVWVATDQFGIPPQNIAWLLVYILAGMLGIILIAGTTVALWLGLRKLVQRD